MRTAGVGPRGAPLLRQASGAGAGTSGRGAAEGPPSPAPQQSRGLNPAHALLLREARQGSGGGRMLPEQVRKVLLMPGRRWAQACGAV